MFHLLLAIIYISFISLGLPDALLGSAWPVMYTQFGVPVSWAGAISVIISAGTIVSSLVSDRLIHRFGTGRVTAASVAATAAALLGFSCSGSFAMLCLWAVPYGLGAGGVDAALNNYVAIHYTSRHMSWLHCMWGLGAAVGPYIMGWVLTEGKSWNMGYRYIGLAQVVLSACLFATLFLWKNRNTEETAHNGRALALKEVLQIKGAKAVMAAFFCYCAAEQTAMLWSGSYLALYCGMSEENAAFFASLFFVGITSGRFLNGFLTMKFSDTQLIRAGAAVMAAGAVIMLLPLGDVAALIGIGLFGFGCAPVYPCIIHSTPVNFGENNSQAVIGVQMASAYVGTCAAPPVFGLIAQHISIGLMPVYILAITAVMFISYNRVVSAKRKAA